MQILEKCKGVNKLTFWRDIAAMWRFSSLQHQTLCDMKNKEKQQKHQNFYKQRQWPWQFNSNSDISNSVVCYGYVTRFFPIRQIHMKKWIQNQRSLNVPNFSFIFFSIRNLLPSFENTRNWTENCCENIDMSVKESSHEVKLQQFDFEVIDFFSHKKECLGINSRLISK